jgi:broad-specificity NMP kinase
MYNLIIGVKILGGILVMSSSRSSEKLNVACESQVLSFNNLKTNCVFSGLNCFGFDYLMSNVSKKIVKSNLNLISSKKGELRLDDPGIVLSLDFIGKAKRVLYLSLNASRDEFIAKMLLCLSGVNENMVQRGALIDGNTSSFDKACSVIYNSRIRVADGSIVEKFWPNIKIMNKKEIIDVIIIDDMEKFKSNLKIKTSNQKTLEYLNEMSENINIPVVVISRD